MLYSALFLTGLKVKEWPHKQFYYNKLLAYWYAGCVILEFGYLPDDFDLDYEKSVMTKAFIKQYK